MCDEIRYHFSGGSMDGWTAQFTRPLAVGALVRIPSERDASRTELYVLAGDGRLRFACHAWQGGQGGAATASAAYAAPRDFKVVDDEGVVTSALNEIGSQLDVLDRSWRGDRPPRVRIGNWVMVRREPSEVA